MKRWMLVALLAVVGLWWWRGGDAERDRDDRSARLAFDRVWIDRVPSSEREAVNGLVLLRKQSLGVFNTASRWRGKYELFRHKARERGVLEVVYPQTGEREQVTVRAGRCDRGGFDYCLELRGATRGVKSYVSKKEWVVGSVEEAAAKVDAILP